MPRIGFALLASCLVAAPATAGRFVAVPEVNTGIEPAAKASAQCRIANQYNTCGTVYWTVGGWCVDDEVATYFELPGDPCLAGCTNYDGNMHIESAEVGFRVVGGTCNNGYPITTYPFDVQYALYAVDPFMCTWCWPCPSSDQMLSSVVTTVPAHTATDPTDPARSFNQVIPFPWSCTVMQPLFGAVRWVAFSVPESVLAGCGEGGESACAWWYPGLRGRNGHANQSNCAIPCTQYFRSNRNWGPEWYESSEVGLSITTFAMWLNVSCDVCPCVDVKNTTWGKLKSLMNR